VFVVGGGVVVVVGGDGVDEKDLRILHVAFCETGGVNRAAQILPACRRTLLLH